MGLALLLLLPLLASAAPVRDSMSDPQEAQKGFNALLSMPRKKAPPTPPVLPKQLVGTELADLVDNMMGDKSQAPAPKQAAPKNDVDIADLMSSMPASLKGLLGGAPKMDAPSGLSSLLSSMPAPLKGLLGGGDSPALAGLLANMPPQFASALSSGAGGVAGMGSLMSMLGGMSPKGGLNGLSQAVQQGIDFLEHSTNRTSPRSAADTTTDAAQAQQGFLGMLSQKRTPIVEQSHQQQKQYQHPQSADEMTKLLTEGWNLLQHDSKSQVLTTPTRVPFVQQQQVTTPAAAAPVARMPTRESFNIDDDKQFNELMMLPN